LLPSPTSSLFPYTTLFRSVFLELEPTRLDGFAVMRRQAEIAFERDDARARTRRHARPTQQIDVVPRRLLDDFEIFLALADQFPQDRKSTRLNSSHVKISYA